MPYLSDNQLNITLNQRPWLWRKGQSGNPAGRPKGKTMKEYARDYLARMTDEEKDGFLDGIPKETIWKMAEGNPQAHTDITTGGEKISQSSILPEIIAEADRLLKERNLGEA